MTNSTAPSSTAYQEAGHAVCRYLNGGPIERVSIIAHKEVIGPGDEQVIVEVAGSVLLGQTPEVERYLSRVKEPVSLNDIPSRLFELDAMESDLPEINYEERAEVALAGEAAEIIRGFKQEPDWKVSGWSDWCQANADIFRILEYPFDEDNHHLIAVPEALQRIYGYHLEMVRLYFDFLYRRATIKLKHNWALVEAVANALTECGELSGEDLQQIIDQHRGEENEE